MHRAHRYPSALRQEVPEARGVEQAGHPDHTLGRESERILRERRHLVERVRDDDHDRVRRGRAHFPADVDDDPAVALEQIGAALPRLPRAPGGDDDDVRAARCS